MERRWRVDARLRGTGAANERIATPNRPSSRRSTDPFHPWDATETPASLPTCPGQSSPRSAGSAWSLLDDLPANGVDQGDVMLRVSGGQVESLFDEVLPIEVRQLPPDLAGRRRRT